MVAINHAPTSVRLTLKLGSLTGRAAFSHVPFLHSILWMTESILMAPKTVDMPQTPMGAMEVYSPSTHGYLVRMLSERFVASMPASDHFPYFRGHLDTAHTDSWAGLCLALLC